MGSRIRVLILVTNLGIGGAQRQVIELARGLDPDRFDTTVATLYGGYEMEDELARSSHVRLLSLDRHGKFDFSTLTKLVRLLKSERFDVIHPFITPSTFFGLLAGMLAGTPVKVGSERNGTRVQHNRIRYSIYRTAEDWLLRRADVVVPNSEAGRATVIAQGVRPERTKVIYNGLSPARTAVSSVARAELRNRLNIPQEALVAGIAARLEEHKDHATFLRAAAEVRTSVDNSYFLIVGDGPLHSELEVFADRLGIADYVRFVGYQLEVGPYIDCCDIAVLSSYDFEGCSNFLLEAMALRKPSVATDIGGNREVVADGENGFLVPIKSPPMLADRIVRLLLDSPLREAMGEDARQKFDSRFSVARMVQEYEDLYTQLWSLNIGQKQEAEALRP